MKTKNMTVKDLIDYLNTLPKDSVVNIKLSRGGHDSYEVEEPLRNDAMDYDKNNNILMINP